MYCKIRVFRKFNISTSINRGGMETIGHKKRCKYLVKAFAPQQGHDTSLVYLKYPVSPIYLSTPSKPSLFTNTRCAQSVRKQVGVA